MTTATDRRVVYALLAIAALCLIGLGASLYRAKSNELKELRQRLAQKETELEESRVKVVKLPDLERKYDRLAARLSVLEPALPDSAYMPTFLSQIEHLAASTNNRILMIRPKEKPNQGKAGATTIDNETGEVVKKTPAPATPGAAPEQAEQEQKDQAPYDYTSIEFKIEGAYPSLVAFLKELQAFPKMIAVNDISFRPAQGSARSEQSTPRLEATLDLTAVIAKGGKHGTTQ